MARVSLQVFNNQMNKLEQALDTLPEAALDYFKSQTPVRSGNARRNTYLRQDTIIADYPYSQRLDDGYSRQSPDGMTAPTEKWIQKEVDRRLKGI